MIQQSHSYAYTLRKPKLKKTHIYPIVQGFPHRFVGKESACSAGDLGFIPGSGRSPGKGNGNPLQYSCLKNPIDSGAWEATVHRVARSRHNLMTKGRERDPIVCCSPIYNR